MIESWIRYVTSLDRGALPDVPLRTSVKSGRTWSVASTHPVVLPLNGRRGGGGVSRLGILFSR